MTADGATGLWSANDAMEASAAVILQPMIAPLEPLARDAYEAAVEAPAVPSQSQASRDKEAAVFLRRALVDFRATWLLLSVGYTSPAAAVAASLWEHALTVVALLADTAAAKPIPETGDAPWGPVELAGFLNRGGNDPRPANAYAAYKWLCKIKHPTLRSALHDSGASTVGDGSFVVMSAPDTRNEDVSVKRIILMLSLARLTAAAEAFVEARNPVKNSSEYLRFRARMERVSSGAARQIGDDPLPFKILPEEMPKQFRPGAA